MNLPIGKTEGDARARRAAGVPSIALPERAGATEDPERTAALQEQVRQLAAERDALILAHNYQLPEIQDVADFIGDSLALSRKAASASQQTIVFCGVHFMAETACVLCPEKTVLIPDLAAGCSLADTIDAAQLRAWKEQHPEAIVVMYVNTSAEVKALTDYCCTSANAVDVVAHIYETRGEDVEILFGPDMWLGSYVEKSLGRKMHIWDGECHVHASIRPADIERTMAEHADADLLVHPECGCTTSVMEYLASGELPEGRVKMLSTGGMLSYASGAANGGGACGGGDKEVLVATETGMLHPLRRAAPGVSFLPVHAEASCRFMKMITLQKLRDCLQSGRFEVEVDSEIAAAARLPIDRMIAIG